MRIFLTGKDGQLGCELHQRLERHITVIAVGREDVDFCNPEMLHAKVRRLPELGLIINCAAYTKVDEAEHEPLKAQLVNVEAPAILAAEADRRNIPIVHFSTDYVFDGQRKSVATRIDATASLAQPVRDAHWSQSVNKDVSTNEIHAQPYTEEDRPNPLSVYGWSKLAGEQRMLELCEKALVFRVSSLCGTRRKNFFTTMLKYMHVGKTPRVVDDQIISPNWTPLIAEAVEHVVVKILKNDFSENFDILQRYQRPTEAGYRTDAVASNRVKAQPCWGLYHLSGIGSTTWYEFARLIFQKSAEIWNTTSTEPIPVSSEEYNAVAERPNYSVLDPTKFETVFQHKLPDWRTQFLYCAGMLKSKK